MAYSVKELLDAARARLKVAFEQVDTDGGDPVLAPVNVVRTAEGEALSVQVSGSIVEQADDADALRVLQAGVKSTSQEFIVQNRTTSGPSAWQPVRGYTRALFLLEGDAGWGTGTDYLRVEGRVDSEVVDLPVYYFNTGIATRYLSFPGYYEVDVAGLSDVRVNVVTESGAPVTLSMWLSAALFIPDAPGHQLTVFNGLAITDTSTHRSPVLSGLGMRSASLVITSTLDKAVTLRCRFLSGMWGTLRDASGAEYSVTVAANTHRVLVRPGDLKLLDGILPIGFQLEAKCAEAPTTGSVTVWLLAEPA